MTVLDLCRVTVQTHRNDGSVAVDLALPTRVELAELLPCVVDIVGGRTVDPTDGITRHWTMSRLDGSVLDDSMTLHENGVRDGEILLLTTARTQITEAAFDDLCHAVINASASADRDDQMTRCMGAAACLCAAGLAAIVFVWSGVSPTNHYAIIAAIVAVAATVGSIVAGRVDAEPLPSLTLGITASAFAAVDRLPGGTRRPRTAESLFGSGRLLRRVDRVAPCHVPRDNMLHRHRNVLDNGGDRRGGRGSLARHRRKQLARGWPPRHSPCWVWRPSCRSSWRVCRRRCPARRTGQATTACLPTSAPPERYAATRR